VAVLVLGKLALIGQLFPEIPEVPVVQPLPLTQMPITVIEQRAKAFLVRAIAQVLRPRYLGI
jgi:hypothetical protein